MTQKFYNFLIGFWLSVGVICLIWRETYQMGINAIVAGLFTKHIKDWVTK